MGIIRILIAINSKPCYSYWHHNSSVTNHLEEEPRRGISGERSGAGSFRDHCERERMATPVRGYAVIQRPAAVHSAKINSRLSEQFVAAGERANDLLLERVGDSRDARTRISRPYSWSFRLDGSAQCTVARERAAGEEEENWEEKSYGSARRTSSKHARRRGRCAVSDLVCSRRVDDEPENRASSPRVIPRTQLTGVSTRRDWIQRNNTNEIHKMNLKSLIRR